MPVERPSSCTLSIIKHPSKVLKLNSFISSSPWIVSNTLLQKYSPLPHPLFLRRQPLRSSCSQRKPLPGASSQIGTTLAAVSFSLFWGIWSQKALAFLVHWCAVFALSVTKIWGEMRDLLENFLAEGARTAGAVSATQRVRRVVFVLQGFFLQSQTATMSSQAHNKI